MIWISAVLFPLAIAALCAFPGRGLKAGFRMLPLAPLPALFLALAGNTFSDTILDDFLLKSSFGTGPFGSTFLLITSICWFAAALFTVSGTQKNSLKSKSFCVMFLLTMCGNIGLVAALDAVTFYTFFALMTFCSYSLIVHTGKDAAIKAGRIYLIMAVLGEGMLIAGIMLAAFSSPSHYFADIAPALAGLPQSHPVFVLLFAGFGIKAGLIFLHFWLPLAHPVAPAPASAVLSGAMIKAGLLGWMNFFPVGLTPWNAWGSVFIILGLGSAIFGVIAGLRQDGPKTVLAYSSISQMGLMTFCLGLGIMDASLWGIAGPALYLLVFNHALCKSALFLGAAVSESKMTRSNKNLLTIILLTVPALALAGAPFTGGAQAKYLLKEAVKAGGLHEIVPMMVSATSVLTTLILIHFMFKIISAKRKKQSALNLPLAWVLLIIIIACLPLLFHKIYPDNQVIWTNLNFFLSSLWPVLTGMIIYFVCGKSIQKISTKIMGVLPDTALIIDRIWSWFNSWIGRLSLRESSRLSLNLVHFTDYLAQTNLIDKASRNMELKISLWTVFSTLFILMIIIFALLGWKGA
ncbi:MAG: complex I subunit 5 family protein [Desulfonatronovibrio sp.]